MNRFLDNVKSLQKRGKKGKKGAKNADFSRTDKCTAKPMVVGCVQHYSTHFIKKLGKWLEPFFHKIQKNAKKGNKGPKRAKKGDFSKISDIYKKRLQYVQAPMDA